MPKFSHKKLGVTLHIRDNLLQKDVEKFSGALRDFEIPPEHTVEYRAAVVKAADVAGWLMGFEDSQAPNLPANVVRWMSNKISGHFVELTTVPPE